MPKILSPLAEGLALRGLCGKNKEVKGLLMASLNETYFRTEQGKESFNYIISYLNKRGETPAFTLMQETAKLSRTTREFLSDCDKVPKTPEHAHQVISTLNDYRRAFLFYQSARSILEEIEKKKMDLDGLTEKAINTLTEVQTGRDSADSVFHFGYERNTDDLVHEIVYGENADNIIPTGYKAWDDRNGGIPRGTLMLLAGETSAGKSHNAVQLAINMAGLGYKVCLVPLEMDEEAVTSRYLANLCKIDSKKILLKQLAKDEKSFIVERNRKWNRRTEKRGGRMTIHKPAGDIAIEPLMAAAHSYNSDVIIIDYISLLAGADGEDQWRKLGSIARYCARYAQIHRKVVILLAQVDDQERIRYAKSLKEHAAIMWTFVSTKETKEHGILKFNVPKARMLDSSPFSMHIDYPTSRVKDFDKDDDSANRKGNKPIKNEDEGMMPDLTET